MDRCVQNLQKPQPKPLGLFCLQLYAAAREASMQRTVLFLGVFLIGVIVLLFRYEYDDAKYTRIDRLTGNKQVQCEGRWLTHLECRELYRNERIALQELAQPQAGKQMSLLEEMKLKSGSNERHCAELARRAAAGTLFAHDDTRVEPQNRWYFDVPESCAHLAPKKPMQ